MTVNFSISVGKGIGPEYFDHTFLRDVTKVLTVELSRLILLDESFILRIVFVVVRGAATGFTPPKGFFAPPTADVPATFLLTEFIKN